MENKIFGVIRDCHESLSWLQASEGTDEKKAPEEHRDNLKQLEKLGIVYKRNGRSLGIRWQRIRKLIERSAHGSAVPNNPQEMLDYFTVSTSAASN